MALLTGGVEMSEEQLMKEIIKEQAQKIINLEQYLRIEKEVNDETIKELEQQKAELIQAIESALNKSTKGGWLHRIFENIIEKHNIKI